MFCVGWFHVPCGFDASLFQMVAVPLFLNFIVVMIADVWIVRVMLFVKNHLVEWLVSWSNKQAVCHSG